MVREMTPVLNDWARDPSVKHVVIEGLVKRGFAREVTSVLCMIGGAPVTLRQPAFIVRNMRSTISSNISKTVYRPD